VTKCETAGTHTQKDFISDNLLSESVSQQLTTTTWCFNCIIVVVVNGVDVNDQVSVNVITVKHRQHCQSTHNQRVTSELIVLLKNVGLAIQTTDAPHEPHQRDGNHRKHQSLQSQPDDCKPTIGVNHLP